MNFFDLDLFEKLRVERGVTWGRPVRSHDELRSTNDEALQAIAGEAKTGIVWIARHQTSGRGRRGNRWVAPAGEGLTFSVLLRYEGPYERLNGASLAVGLGVRDALARFVEGEVRQEPVQVKWPNDVYVDGKKIAGVLIETRRDPRGGWGLALGVGLNVFTREFPSDLPDATSLVRIGVPEESLGFEALLVELLGGLEARLQAFLSRGMASLLPDLGACDFLRDKPVRVGPVFGVARGFDSEGRLLVETKRGEVQAIESGHVELGVEGAD